MDQINLDRHLETTNRLIALDKSLKRDMKEVKTAANKQAIIQPTTWATIAGENSKAPVLTAGGTMTIVNKTTVQKKLNREAELCSRQVIVDLKALATPEYLTRAMSGDYTYNGVDLLVDTLQEYDEDIDINELKSARVMSNHVEKPYMVEFFDKANCERFLAATSAAKVDFKDIHPSPTKKQREDLKKACELKQANGQASSTDGESKRKRQTRGWHSLLPPPYRETQTRGRQGNKFRKTINRQWWYTIKYDVPVMKYLVVPRVSPNETNPNFIN